MSESEVWKKIPQSGGYEFSSLGRLRNPRGYALNPRVQHGIRNPYHRVAYFMKRAGITTMFYPSQSMPEMFPSVEPPFFDSEWADMIRSLNQQRPQQFKPANTASGPTSRAACVREYTGWTHDPWDEMHLWNRESDYFNPAQYCPCL